MLQNKDIKYFKGKKSKKYILGMVVEVGKKSVKVLAFENSNYPSYKLFSIYCDYKDAELDNIMLARFNILYTEYEQLNLCLEHKKKLEKDKRNIRLMTNDYVSKEVPKRIKEEKENIERFSESLNDVYYSLALSILPVSENTLGKYMVKKFNVGNKCIIGVCLSNIDKYTNIDILYVEDNHISIIQNIDQKNIDISPVRFKTKELRQAFIDVALSYNENIKYQKEYDRYSLYSLKSDEYKDLLNLISQNMSKSQELLGIYITTLIYYHNVEFNEGVALC